PFGNEDRVLEVVTTPGHEGHQHVAAECELAAIRTRPAGNDLAFFYGLTDGHDRTLVDTRVLVRPLELNQRIDVRRNLTRDRSVDAVVGLDDDAFGVDVVNDAVSFRDDDRARVTSRDLLHTGSDVRRFGTQKRNRLALHVRTHQRTVRVVVLEERDQRCRNGNQLFRADIHVLDVGTTSRDEFTLLPGGVPLVHEISFLVELDVRLADDPLVLFPSGQIERIRLEFSFLAAFLLDLLVRLLDVFLRNMFPRLELRVAAVMDLDVLDHTAVHDLSIRRFNKGEL